MNLSHQFQFKSSKRFFNRENEIRGRAVTILVQYVHKRERERDRERTVGSNTEASSESVETTIRDVGIE